MMYKYVYSNIILDLLLGYGTPSGPGAYQNWGAPPGPQGQQMPPQWGSSYGAPPQQTGYGSYGEFNPVTDSYHENLVKY